MWNYIQLAVQIPDRVPEADYFLKSINTPFFMNLFRLLLAGGTIIMLVGIDFFLKRDSRRKDDEKTVDEEG